MTDTLISEILEWNYEQYNAQTSAHRTKYEELAGSHLGKKDWGDHEHARFTLIILATTYQHTPVIHDALIEILNVHRKWYDTHQRDPKHGEVKAKFYRVIKNFIGIKLDPSYANDQLAEVKSIMGETGLRSVAASARDFTVGTVGTVSRLTRSVTHGTPDAVSHATRRVASSTSRVASAVNKRALGFAGIVGAAAIMSQSSEAGSSLSRLSSSVPDVRSLVPDGRSLVDSMSSLVPGILHRPVNSTSPGLESLPRMWTWMGLEHQDLAEIFAGLAKTHNSPVLEKMFDMKWNEKSGSLNSTQVNEFANMLLHPNETINLETFRELIFDSTVNPFDIVPNMFSESIVKIWSHVLFPLKYISELETEEDYNANHMATMYLLTYDPRFQNLSESSGGNTLVTRLKYDILNSTDQPPLTFSEMVFLFKDATLTDRMETKVTSLMSTEADDLSGVFQGMIYKTKKDILDYVLRQASNWTTASDGTPWAQREWRDWDGERLKIMATSLIRAACLASSQRRSERADQWAKKISEYAFASKCMDVEVGEEMAVFKEKFPTSLSDGKVMTYGQLYIYDFLRGLDMKMAEQYLVSLSSSSSEHADVCSAINIVGFTEIADACKGDVTLFAKARAIMKQLEESYSFKLRDTESMFYDISTVDTRLADLMRYLPATGADDIFLAQRFLWVGTKPAFWNAVYTNTPQKEYSLFPFPWRANDTLVGHFKSVAKEKIQVFQTGRRTQISDAAMKAFGVYKNRSGEAQRPCVVIMPKEKDKKTEITRIIFVSNPNSFHHVSLRKEWGEDIVVVPFSLGIPNTLSHEFIAAMMLQDMGYKHAVIGEGDYEETVHDKACVTLASDGETRIINNLQDWKFEVLFQSEYDGHKLASRDLLPNERVINAKGLTAVKLGTLVYDGDGIKSDGEFAKANVIHMPYVVTRDGREPMPLQFQDAVVTIDENSEKIAYGHNDVLIERVNNISSPLASIPTLDFEGDYVIVLHPDRRNVSKVILLNEIALLNATRMSAYYTMIKDKCDVVIMQSYGAFVADERLALKQYWYKALTSEDEKRMVTEYVLKGETNTIPKGIQEWDVVVPNVITKTHVKSWNVAVDGQGAEVTFLIEENRDQEHLVFSTVLNKTVFHLSKHGSFSLEWKHTEFGIPIVEALYPIIYGDTEHYYNVAMERYNTSIAQGLSHADRIGVKWTGGVGSRVPPGEDEVRDMARKIIELSAKSIDASISRRPELIRWKYSDRTSDTAFDINYNGNIAMCLKNLFRDPVDNAVAAAFFKSRKTEGYVKITTQVPGFFLTSEKTEYKHYSMHNLMYVSDNPAARRAWISLRSLIEQGGRFSTDEMPDKSLKVEVLTGIPPEGQPKRFHTSKSIKVFEKEIDWTIQNFIDIDGADKEGPEYIPYISKIPPADGERYNPLRVEWNGFETKLNSTTFLSYLCLDNSEHSVEKMQAEINTFIMKHVNGVENVRVKLVETGEWIVETLTVPRRASEYKEDIKKAIERNLHVHSEKLKTYLRGG